jgi:hypothetical protein
MNIPIGNHSGSVRGRYQYGLDVVTGIVVGFVTYLGSVVI